MLTQLRLENFAIVESLELEFTHGMTVITGETGAGKSIIIDALQLVLGHRLDGKVVREGSERCDLSAIFTIKNHPTISQWLLEHELDADGECHLRRTITHEGKSRTYINGHPCPLQQLSTLGSFLVTIHGQHQHQHLLKRDYQRNILDEYANLAPLLNSIKVYFLTWKSIREKIANLQNLNGQHHKQQDFLAYQLEEFQKLALEKGEYEKISEEHRRLTLSDRFIQTYENALALLSEQDGQTILSLMHQLKRIIGELENQANLNSLLENALINLNEAEVEIRHLLQEITINPERIQWLENRLAAIHQLARKHKIKPEELPQYYLQIQREQNALAGIDEELLSLEKELQEIQQLYFDAAHELKKLRHAAALELDAKVTAVMAEIGLPQGKFKCTLEDLPATELYANGLERVDFMVQMNPGQAFQPLNKVASGGELSRISLAIQVITAKQITVPTLVFDEVDVGIGGAAAEIVGKKLKQLSQAAQVICITHLPQVAAQGHQHLRVEKKYKNNTTQTSIFKLECKDRIDEIARMLGGIKITQSSRDYAKEMLAVVE